MATCWASPLVALWEELSVLQTIEACLIFTSEDHALPVRRDALDGIGFLHVQGELLASENQALLVWQDALFVLDPCFDVVDGVAVDAVVGVGILRSYGFGFCGRRRRGEIR